MKDLFIFSAYVVIGGFHQNSNVSTFDKVKLRWAEKYIVRVDTESEEQITLPKVQADSGGKVASTRGWALKKKKKQVRFKQQLFERCIQDWSGDWKEG